MSLLSIRHVPGDQFLFQVSRPDGKSADPALVPSPASFPVEARPDTNLLRELRWYLEDFLTYPFSPETEHAERVLAALRNWGTAAFQSLFGGGKAAAFFLDAIREGTHALHLQVWSDDPRVLSWPWEALRDPEAHTLGHTSEIERRLNKVKDPLPIPEDLPRDRVNILLVTARPKGVRDVAYRSVSRRLVELVEKKNLPAHVHVLRPPTLQRLQEHLRERPHFYHLLHFDGHGAYGTNPAAHAHGSCFQGEGCLVFEAYDATADPIGAERLSALLQEHAVPAAVLNACQSAMLDEGAPDPFASVAASLLKAGIRSVVAMAYSLFVTGAEVFLPAFYERLFQTGSVSGATCAGRQGMLTKRGRACARGRFPLEDWLVPVLYQQAPLDFPFAQDAQTRAAQTPVPLPAELREAESPHGFIGRDSAILELERAMRGSPAGILLHGLGGVGKTTLAKGFLKWLLATEGLDACHWLSFQEIRSAEYVFNRLGEAFCGGAFSAGALELRLNTLASVLKDRPCLLVWDNFEVVRGSEVMGLHPTLSTEDSGYLLRFLEALRGGRTKVLITSRSEEDWLGIELRRVPLGGLQGEERWEYADAILEDLRVPVSLRDDPEFKSLMDALEGHPLSMRVILPRLEKETPAEVLQRFYASLADIGDAGDESQRRLYATLHLAEASLREPLRPLLIPLALHDRFVDADSLATMAKKVDTAIDRPRIDEFLEALAANGLLLDRGHATCEIHPLLGGYLRERVLKTTPKEVHEGWARAFIDFMARFSDHLAPIALHEQRAQFFIHGANLHEAVRLAKNLRMQIQAAALTQALATYALNTRRFKEAQAHFAHVSELCHTLGHSRGQAGALHELGIIAQQERDFLAARTWYERSLAIKEKIGDEHGAAQTYHQLGMVAEDERHFPIARDWYQKALGVFRKLRDERSAAQALHQLGIVAQEERDFPAARMHYMRSLATREKPGDEHGAAKTYHQLGTLAQEERDFRAAREWYGKSLAIEKKLGDEYGVATTLCQLGRIAEDEYDFPEARALHMKGLEIFERLQDEPDAAKTYHQLGTIAMAERDFQAAQVWYDKALSVQESLGNEHGVAMTLGQLGALELRLRNSLDAGRYIIRALKSFLIHNDPHNAEIAARNFLQAHAEAPAAEKAVLRELWRDARVGDFPEQPEPN